MWNRLLELLDGDLEFDASPEKIEQLRELYTARLSIPHRAIEHTFSAFSSFVTNYDNANYESVMVSTNRLYSAAKAKFDEREMYELNLKRAVEAANTMGSKEDHDAEWKCWSDYLAWETSMPRKKQDMDLTCALFERACLRYDIHTFKFWEWYLDHMVWALFFFFFLPPPGFLWIVD